MCWGGGAGGGIEDSGRWIGVGEEGGGRLRPRGPSGEDWREVLVNGLAVDEVLLGVAAEAGVRVRGTEELIAYLILGVVEGIGDGQHLFPSSTWTGVVAAGMVQRTFPSFARD